LINVELPICFDDGAGYRHTPTPEINVAPLQPEQLASSQTHIASQVDEGTESSVDYTGKSGYLELRDDLQLPLDGLGSLYVLAKI
jgi:hypothetical protein